MAKAFAAWVVGSTIALYGNTPQAVRVELLIATLFIFVDSAAGFWGAVVTGTLASAKMRTKLVTKLVQYSILVMLTAGVALLLNSYSIIEAGIGVVITIEAVSMLEHLSMLEKNGGVNLGPASPFIRRLSKVLDVPYNPGVIIDPTEPEKKP